MLARIRSDVRTALENDPAADHWAEVLLTYAGLHAVWGHVLAHAVWERGHKVTARVLSHLVRALTGVEIHPAADVGQPVFIDHGMGTVVGETAVIGDGVQMYHGVTLGGKSSEPVKRHPTVEDGVTIGADATLIGDITIGEDATVGAGAVVVDDVEPGETVAGVPAKPLESDGGRAPADVVEGAPEKEAGPDEVTDTDDVVDPTDVDGDPCDGTCQA